MKKLNNMFKFFIYLLPFALLFSYYPVIPFGSDGSMNFELSVPLIWLLVFDIFGISLLFYRDGFRRVFGEIFRNYRWLLFPAFLTLSCAWSPNMVRGILTVGILWLIYLAGFLFYSFRKLLDKEFWQTFKKIFFGAGIFICVVLFLQCILDLVGVSREYTLMCVGCTYRSFGFPHPNGFAIEPQFMGNLLLAPMLIASKEILTVVACPAGTLRAALAKSSCPAKHVTAKISLLVFALATGLFLTFSRGAIYAGVVGLVFLTAFEVVRTKKWNKVLKIWGVVVLAFLFTLNLQGVMAEVSKTDDTYVSGVAKVLNHLSLGVIDIREKKEERKEKEEVSLGIVGAGETVGVDELSEGAGEAVELDEILEEEGKEEAYFDGYVAESTDVRVGMTSAAVRTWQKDFKTILIGTGLGGAGVAMYENGETEWSKEIVQNQYASLLLETGVAGISLLIFSLVLLIREILKQKQAGLIFALMVAYGISLFFFSGLPNVLHIYLLLPLFIIRETNGRS